MSAVNTEYDVSIAKYNCSSQKVVDISFKNDHELHFDTRRVLIEIVKNRLYFIDNKGKGSLAVQKNGHVLVGKQFDKVSKFEGRYDLEFDREREQYFIDKNNLVKHYEHKWEQKGIKKQQPRRERENRPEIESTKSVSITQKGKMAVEHLEVEKLSAVKNPIEDKAFMFGLINLLKEQCKDNIKALYTINTLEESIERRIK